ncbi:Bug family tripartite tricarboxylate transporter substrate binding protein [Ottowia sp.]|uniref:Bug family tripartite tricarboxylate transporter substrate binding protein n=1 Tax=Ottowia sp. TaxID=1898956 RepID=UPI0039E6AEDB
MAASVASSALAQDAGYPSRPVKMVVAWSPGGATDLLARQVAVELGKQLGQSVVVDNKPGAGGTIGHALVAKSAPDGYTLVLATNSTYAIAEHLYKSLPYKHERDLAPVSLLASSPLILAARTGLPAKNAGDLVALARSQPGKINIASGGAGSTSHLAGELFMALTGTSMTHVPYKGGGPANTAVVAGEVDVAFLDLGVALPFAASGKIKAVGSSGAKRSPLLPEVPTIGESGVPRFESTTTFALFAPAGTPRSITDRLAQAVRASLAEPELRDKLSRQGIDIVASTPDELGRSVATESARWERIIRERHITID